MTQLQPWLGNSLIHDHIGWSSMAIEAPNHSPGGQSFTALEVNLHVTQFTASMEDLHEVGPPWTWRLTFMSPLLRTSLKDLHITQLTASMGGPPGVNPPQPWRWRLAPMAPNPQPPKVLNEGRGQGDKDLFFFSCLFCFNFLIQRGIIVFLTHFYYLFDRKVDRCLAPTLSPNLSLEFLKLETRVLKCQNHIKHKGVIY